MLSFSKILDQWQHDPDDSPTLEQRVYDQIGLAYQRYDYLTLDLGLCPNSEYVLKADAYITGLEKLLEWSE